MEKTKFTSICLLAYKRPEQLRETIKSIKENTTAPYELIVNLDGNDRENIEYLVSLINIGDISKLILNTSLNRGVGTSFANCVGVSEGDYICKCDTDLTFKTGWLKKGIDILESTAARGVGFFDYKNYDPNDHRFDQRLNFKEHMIVEDLVSSCYLFKREDLGSGDYTQDDGFHQTLKPLAITIPDMVSNHGFGVTKSVYVSGTEDHPVKTKTYDTPKVFNA